MIQIDIILDASTIVVTLNNSADFENQSSYTFDVLATDPLSGTDTETVTVSVRDVIEKYGDNPADTIELNHEDFSVAPQLQVWV